MRIVALYNIKGGVGKTASAVNLAYLSATEGHRTLIWDLDPQGAASFYLQNKTKIKKHVDVVHKRKGDLHKIAHSTEYENLDIIPADFSFRNLDLSWSKAKKPAHQLLKMLRTLSQEYDYLFLDCPPNISLVSENVFLAADALLIPMLPTTLSVRTYSQLQRYLKQHKFDQVCVYPFFTMVDKRKKMHQEIMAELFEKRVEFLNSAIPYNSMVERMGEHAKPLPQFAAESVAAEAYRVLWQELEALL